MSKSTDQLVRIVSTGANIVIGSKSTDQLVRIVSEAVKSGSHVTIKCNKSTDQLVCIAKAAGGDVTFDLTE